MIKEAELAIERLGYTDDRQGMLHLYMYLKETFSKLLPMDIEIEDRMIKLDDKELNLRSKSKIFNVFEVFLNQVDRSLTKSQLVNLLFKDHSEIEDPSHRQLMCWEQNVTKRLCRSRRLAREVFGKYKNFVLDWFYYDQQTKCYQLVRIR